MKGKYVYREEVEHKFIDNIKLYKCCVCKKKVEVTFINDKTFCRECLSFM